MVFGFGFWWWSVPMLAVLVTLLRANPAARTRLPS
jgi:hypothetical protein